MNLPDSTKIACPLPLKGPFRLLKLYQVQDLVDEWHKQLGISVEDHLLGLQEVALYECEDTGFKWFQPNGLAADSRLYEQLSEIPWYYAAEKWEYSQVRNWINEHHTVLEIGSGNGEFASIMKGHGLSFVGLEPNKKAVNYAVKRGLDIRPEMLDEHIKTGCGKYDVICSFQVLEHIEEPFDLLKQMSDLVVSKGLIICSVPDDEFMSLVDPDRRSLLNAPPHHVSMWTERAFRSVGQAMSLTLVNVIREPLADIHVPWFVVSKVRQQFRYMPRLLQRALLNKVSLSPLIWFVSRCLKQNLPGHTLIAIYQKNSHEDRPSQ